MIIKISKSKLNPFVMLDKRILSDRRLTWKSKGVLAYLLSKPDDWRVMIGDLLNQGSEGITVVRSALRELEKFGYAELKVLRNESGDRSSGKSWVIYEQPNGRESEISDLQETSLSENLTVRKPDPTNTRNTTKKEKATESEVSPAVAPLGNTAAIPSALSSENFYEAWSEFLDARKERKKPVSFRAATMMLKKLEGYGLEGAIESLNQSVENDWTGVFPVRKGLGANKTSSRRETSKQLVELTRQCIIAERNDDADRVRELNKEIYRLNNRRQ